MIPRQVLQEVGGFPVGVRRGGDLATWARIAVRYPIAWSPLPSAIYHLSADNRASDIHPAHADVPDAAELERVLAASGPAVSPTASIREYLVFMRLAIARHYSLAGQRALALDLLAKTSGTVTYARQRRTLALLLWLPPAVLNAALKSKAFLRTTLNAFPARRAAAPVQCANAA
jgi:hypothetical protein